MTGADYLNLIKRPVEKIHVPHFGEVHVRGLSAPEYETLESKSMRTIDGKEQFVVNSAVAIRYGMVNEDGSPIWTDADLQALSQMPMNVVLPLRNRIMRLSGVGINLGNS